MSLSILTQQVCQEHFLPVSLSQRMPNFNIYTLLPSCTKVHSLGEKSVREHLKTTLISQTRAMNFQKYHLRVSTSQSNYTF